ncbi:hypothetical protein E2C01_025359 [Portunus trituberculatus]|uniref:Uncharacterized protein n=1 Tax=Portunus trituberculatus TaxID=210409 RepID=A0A5B7EFS3_PORTR|nr:hypothetical protein [Portunus trituberculatus]
MDLLAHVAEAAAAAAAAAHQRQLSRSTAQPRPPMSGGASRCTAVALHPHPPTPDPCAGNFCQSYSARYSLVVGEESRFPPLSLCRRAREPAFAVPSEDPQCPGTCAVPRRAAGLGATAPGTPLARSLWC